MEAQKKKRRSGPSGKHRTPRKPAPGIPGNPLDALVRAAFARNAERMAGPRTIPDLVRVTGFTLARIGMAMQGRRKMQPEVCAAVAKALEVDEAAVLAAAAETWAMRPVPGAAVAAEPPAEWPADKSDAR